MTQLTTLAVFAALAATAFGASAETKFWVLKPVPILRAAGGTGSPGPTPAEITLASALLPEGRLGKAYNFDLRTVTTIQGAGQDWGAVSWALGGGTMPQGMSLANDGKISGTPEAQTGAAGMEVTVIGSYKTASDQQVYSIKVGGQVLQARQITAANGHSCAVTASGGAKCWGINSAGQLGNNSTANSSVPVDVVGLTSGVASISAGTGHTCAVTTAGGVKCWGYNNTGQLGDNTTAQRLVPVDVVGLGTGVVSLASGFNHNCAITSSGGAKCWGSNNTGQLGNNTNVNSFVPVDVVGMTSGVESTAIGYGHTCAVSSSGAARCWGSNGGGQLGNNSKTQSLVPVDVVGLSSGVAKIAAGMSHTCAITSAGGAKCWGAGGSLGNNSSAQSLVPVDVMGLSGALLITAGNSHNCAITIGGAAKCWGANGTGQLGNGSTTQSLVPADVARLSTGAESIYAGGSHTCAISNSGDTTCWGWGGNGQLGNNSTANSPVQVGVVE